MGSALPRVASCPQTPFHVNSLQGPLHLRTAVLFQPPPPPWLPQVPRAELGVRTGWFPNIAARLGAEVPASRLPVPLLCLLLWPLCCGRSLQTEGQVKLFPGRCHHRQPAPHPLQPADDGMPAGTAGRPCEPSPHRPQPRRVWEVGMGRRWPGTGFYWPQWG